MQGVATDPPSRGIKPWAWVIALIGINAGSSVGGLGLSDARSLALAGSIGVLSGGAWQLGYRRDLAARLGLLSVLFVVGLLFSLLPGANLDIDESRNGTYALWGVVAGLVLTEHLLRWRDTRRERAESLAIVMARHEAG